MVRGAKLDVLMVAMLNEQLAGHGDGTVLLVLELDPMRDGHHGSHCLRLTFQECEFSWPDWRS